MRVEVSSVRRRVCVAAVSDTLPTMRVVLRNDGEKEHSEDSHKLLASFSLSFLFLYFSFFFQKRLSNLDCIHDLRTFLLERVRRKCKVQAETGYVTAFGARPPTNQRSESGDDFIGRAFGFCPIRWLKKRKTT